MKTINNKILFTALFLSTGTVGCKKLMDINKNPNQPTEDVIKAEHIFPNAALATGANTALGYGWLNNWMGYWSPSGSFNPVTEEATYAPTNTFQEPKWQGVYNTLFDLHKTIEKAKVEGENYYRAMSLTLTAHLFQNLVDIYGNIPYTQAFNQQFPSPKYDDAKAIYADLQLKLDTAIGLFKTATVTNRAKAVDIVYAGNSGLWIKLANSIKLRLLIRATEDNANPTAEIAKIKANGGVLQSGESADVNLDYQNSAGKQSPFFANFGLLPSGEDANTFSRANAFSIENFKTRADQRLGWFFKKAKSPANAANPYVGTVYGRDADTEFNGDRTSNIGIGLVRSYNQPQWIFTSVESMFLQTEALLRGWDIGGPISNVNNAFVEAVRESYIWLKVDTARPENPSPAAAVLLADDYMSRRADITDSTTFQSKLNLIIREKYLALTGLNPLEAWSDYRRLGLPANIPLSVNPNAVGKIIPLRLPYPSTEFAVNAANVQAQGTINPQTSKIFWDK